MGRAGLDNAVSNMASAQLDKAAVAARASMAPAVHEYNPMLGYGIHHKGIVGRGGGMIGYGSVFHPPALASQPFSANFQFQHFLPVQYQHFNSGMGIHGSKGFGLGGSGGLYAGKGLY
jgi:hypothetical protein